MKRISIHQLVPGMKIAEDVYNYHQQLILPRNTVLTDDMITRLSFYNIICVYIEDAQTVPNPSPDSGQPRSYTDQLKSSQEFKKFKINYDREVSHFKNELNDIITQNTPLDTDDLFKSILALLDSSDKNISIFDMLHSMRSYNDATYTHCLNVSLICNIFSEWLNFSEEDKKTATLCGLLHDVGKLMVPLDILNKPSKLTDREFEIIKQHSINGYKMLMHLHAPSPVCNAALLHHEKCDGTGYPYGTTGDRLDNFTKMVTIADIYDAMTCARIYRGPLCPLHVIELFEEEGFQKYDTEYLLTFFSHVAQTYLSYRVRLNNGQEGQIIYINPNRLGRPTIKCGSEFIDLSKRPDLSIDCFV